MDTYYDSWIRTFFDAAESIPALTSTDVAVYFALVAIAHAAGGEELEFSAAVKTIESKARVTRSTVYKSTNRLQQFGLISVRSMGGRAAAKYRLCLFTRPTETTCWC